MKIIVRFLALFALFALLLVPNSSAQAQGSDPDGGKIVVGSNFTLESGEELNGGLVVFGGNVVIEDGASVTGGVVVFGGTVTSNGDIEGDIVVIGGQVSLEESSFVSGDVVTIGGQLDRAAGAEIGGEIVNNAPAPEININPPFVPDVQVPPVISEPRVDVWFNPFFEIAKAFGVSLVVAVLGMLATLFFQKRLDYVGQAVVSQPLMSGSVGLLTIVALVVMAVTLILLPFAFLGLFPLAFAWLFGIIAMGKEVGERFANAIRQDWAPVIATGLGTFFVALLVASTQVLNFLPLIACVTWIIPVFVGLVGIGAVVITRFGARPAQSPALSVYSPPADSGPTPESQP